MCILFVVMQFNRPMLEMKKILVIEAFTICFEQASIYSTSCGEVIE
jgi:hypothetical protein